MTAWSAKVFKSSICDSENGPGAARPTVIAPTTFPSRNIGTDNPPRTWCAPATVGLYSASCKTSGTCTTARLSTARPANELRSGFLGYRVRANSRPSDGQLCVATRSKSSPSSRWTLPRKAPHSLTALRTRASNTGWTSVGELEMTLGFLGLRGLWTPAHQPLPTSYESAGDRLGE